MAVTMTRTCDFPMGRGSVCPNDAPHRIELTADDIVYSVDVCDEHKQEVIDSVREAFNFRPTASWVNGMRRNAHIAASGKVFTTAEARAWAIEQGLTVGRAQGRLAKSHIDLYAASH